MKKFNREELYQYLKESICKVKIDWKDKETENKIRQEVKRRIENGKLRDGAEMAEHYQNILNSVFGTNSICDVSDNDLLIFYYVVDDEYEKHGFESDLTGTPNHDKNLVKQLQKLKEIQSR